MFPDVSNLITDDVLFSNDFSDFSDDIFEFSVTEDEFNDALSNEMPRLVESDFEFLDDGEDMSFLPDDFVVSEWCS